MEVATSDIDAAQHALSKAHSAEAFQRLFLVGFLFLFLLFNMDKWIRVELSVAVVAMDSFVERRCNRRGEAVSGVDKGPGSIHAGDSFALMRKTQAGIAGGVIHSYERSSCGFQCFSPLGPVDKYEIKHTFVVLNSTIGCV